LIVAALSELFRLSNNFLIAAIATGVIALLFQPLRERLQRGINRFLYGERDEPIRVLNQLGSQLENTSAPEAALPVIVDTIATTLRVPYVALEWTAEDGARVPAARYGAPRPDIVRLPLRFQNQSLGELLVAPRSPGEKFTAADLQLLDNLARQAGAVVYTARLNSQLQQSRERIINEREQERKRLRRDLHDGLGPTLASQTLKLDAALELVNGDDAANAGARKILQDLKVQTQTTVADIRRIVYELRPPALDDLGLLGALRAHLAQSNDINGLQITFNASELPPLSAAVQVNAYRIVLEAVTNVVKHAGAQKCIVTLSGTDNLLQLSVQDDGIGIPANPPPGVGLGSMRERAQELGGTFMVESVEPQGTRVIARLPIQQPSSST
jgi:signal transduction histidine kinase